jgi:hypothetical protein
MFTKSSNDCMPASAELSDFIHTICPVDAHIYVTMRGTWSSGLDGFRGQYMSTKNTVATIVRVFTCGCNTYWTLENWQHDNGYRCELTVLTKEQFLSLVK